MTWLDDGKATITTEGNTAHCTSDESGSQCYNAMWKPEGLSPMEEGSTTCWCFTIGDGTYTKVGVTTEDFFAPGWKCKGLFYGGNTSDGGALITQKFGPSLKAGDVVKLIVAMTPENLEIGVVVNDRRYGLAFNIPTPYPTPLFPVVSFGRSGASASIEECADIPEGFREREMVRPTGFEGTWTPAPGTPILANIPPEMAQELIPTITLKPKESQMDVNTKVINSGGFRLTKGAGDGDWTADGPGRSTMMMGPPMMMEVERWMMQLIEGIQHIDVDTEDGTDVLNISSSANPSGPVAFHRHFDIPATCTSNPFA